MNRAHDLRDYLAGQENTSLLRFLTCGSVDDGKSTLIGRLLFDSKLIFEDHLAALAKDSRKHGTTGEDIFTMHFSHYAEAPSSVAEEVISKATGRATR